MKIVKADLPLERFELPREEAIAWAKSVEEPYKVELITDLPEDAAISFYKQGDFTDLCAGPHLMSTGKVGKATFKSSAKTVRAARGVAGVSVGSDLVAELDGSEAEEEEEEEDL